VTYDIVGVTYDVVVTDLRFRRRPTTSYVQESRCVFTELTKQMVCKLCFQFLLQETVIYA
jgi:hypothetical protein